MAVKNLIKMINYFILNYVSPLPDSRGLSPTECEGDRASEWKGRGAANLRANPIDKASLNYTSSLVIQTVVSWLQRCV